MCIEDVVAKSAEFAAINHHGQFRKDGITPYIVHPARVASYVYRFGASWPEAIVAWWHDLFEDCPLVTTETLKHFFNSLATETYTNPMPEDQQNMIIGSVQQLTCIKNGLPREEYKANYLQQLTDGHRITHFVKLCDRLDNLCNLHEQNEDFQTLYVRESEDLLKALNPLVVDEYGEPGHKLASFVTVKLVDCQMALLKSKSSVC